MPSFGTAGAAPAGTSAVQLLLSPADRPMLLDRLRRAPTTHRFVVSGAHGGAGASTVAAMLDPARVGIAVEAPPAAAGGGCPVLVARSTAYGLARAASVLADWPAGAPRPWLVLVADAPAGLPAVARFRLRAICGAAAGVARVRYLHRLRGLDDPAAALTDPAVARVAARLRSQLSNNELTRNRREAIA